MLVGVIVVLEVVLGVLGISERVGGAATERMPLRLCISLRVGVLGGGEVSRGGDSAGIKLCGYYTFLVGVLARLLIEANCVCFLR